MMESWFKWFFLCTLGTFPYNLWGLVMGAVQPTFQANGFLTGAFILFSGFVTFFYYLDKWLNQHNYQDFSKDFLQVVGIKFMLSLLGIVLIATLETIVRLEYLFYTFFADVHLTFDFYKLLREHYKETAKILLTNPEWYKLFKLLILVPIYLVVESVILVLGTWVLAVFKQRFWEN